jgi:hypothetical protein
VGNVVFQVNKLVGELFVWGMGRCAKEIVSLLLAHLGLGGEAEGGRLLDGDTAVDNDILLFEKNTDVI